MFSEILYYIYYPSMDETVEYARLRDTKAKYEFNVIRIVVLNTMAAGGK
jgi:hypothetical protein